MKELLELYYNYLFALKEREEYGSTYGDTDELMKMYEDELEKQGVKVKVKEK